MKALSLLMIFALGARAQETAIQQRGRKVVDTALEALGGAQFLAVTSRTEQGRLYSFHNDRTTGAARAKLYTAYISRPEGAAAGFFGQRERQSFLSKKDKEERAVIFNELEAYDLGYRGATPIAKDVYDRYRDSALRNIFYILKYRRNEKGMIFEYRETTTLNNLPVEVVDITDDENRVVKVYFHMSTHLPLRQVYERRNPETRELNEEISMFTKYRDVGGGVKWPFNITRHRNGEKIFELFSESVKINEAMNDSQFKLPTGITIIKPR